MTDQIYTVSCHILNSHEGKPLEKITCELHELGLDGSYNLASQETDKDGRVGKDLWKIKKEKFVLSAGKTYMIRFQTKKCYYDIIKENTLYPYIDIPFLIAENDSRTHYHIPLLLNNFGYTTYRGS
ncbi:hypothetical protein QEN19_001757 [Hanseniaspora menglaensis]